MDYEKEYKDAVARMELCVRTGLKITPEYIFPELKESEDERIRKFLIEILSHGSWRKEWPFSPNEVVAWLEKKKEQKFVDLHDKIKELCSKYPINKYSMSDKELSAYHQGIHFGATKLAEYLSEQKS